MKFVVKDMPLKLVSASVLLNPGDVAELGLVVGDRVRVAYGRQSCIKDVHIATGMLRRGEVGFCETRGPCDMKIMEGETVDVTPIPRPRSVDYIRKKMTGSRLAADEVHAIIQDISDNMLNEVEITAFVMANYYQSIDFDETEAMARAMIATGGKIVFDNGNVVDKHSIGGVPGNEISLLVVPVIASSGLLIPKTSSRAITSASGTADTMEVLADVSLDIAEIKEITQSTGGVIAWGGATDIAPADDVIIRVERHLSIDPWPQLLASVMGKKGAVGAKHVVIDIPVGPGTKVTELTKGRELANDFTELGRRLGLNVSCLLTYGAQPVGRAIGPALEAQEALAVLEGGPAPDSLVEKATGIAGRLLEISGLTPNGAEVARDAIRTGRALAKMQEIIAAQGGTGITRSADVPVGPATADVRAESGGTISRMDNPRLVRVARAAGAPKDKGAGLLLHGKTGSHIRAGDPLFTIFAEKEWKLSQAIELARREPPVIVSGMILETFPQYTVS